MKSQIIHLENHMAARKAPLKDGSDHPAHVHSEKLPPQDKGWNPTNYSKQEMA